MGFLPIAALPVWQVAQPLTIWLWSGFPEPPVFCGPGEPLLAFREPDEAPLPLGAAAVPVAGAAAVPVAGAAVVAAVVLAGSVAKLAPFHDTVLKWQLLQAAVVAGTLSCVWPGWSPTAILLL